MATVMAGNHPEAADNIHWFVIQIDCLCHWHFAKYFLMILNCLPGVVVLQIGYREEPELLSSLEIYMSTSSVNKD